ncbi:TonB-dependent receptor, partial [Helicobacter sp. T3_23-1059]
YQNNFQIDGFNMNNDLEPAGGTTNGPTTLRGGRSQGLNIDTSLLESITVLDSNVSASYGGFTGGVVEAQVRKPRKDNSGINGWHANISYQHTSNHLTQYHIHQDQEANFATSADENYQPQFHKHLIKSSVEGYITENLGLIASFNTTQSFIPLQAYGDFMGAGADSKKTREQKRQSYNYYAKIFYNPSENLTIEANLAYMPQFNTYYHALAKDSYYSMESGGWQAGLKALWQSNAGLWTNSLGYSRLENSRRSDTNYWLSWFVSDEKNWAYSPTASVGTARANEGGYGDIDELQNTLNYKSDFTFSPLSVWRTAHNFRVGVDLDYQKLGKNRLNEYYGFTNPAPLVGQSCPNTPDSFGIWSCSNVRPKDKVPNNATFNQLGWNANWDTIVGQYFNLLTFYLPKGNVEFDNIAYGAFVEDDINFDLGKVGEINTRLGLRFDGDSYMSKQSLAPRFSINYATPASSEFKTQITFGANRYYGRNLFSYRFYDYLNSSASQWTRNSPNDAWVESTNPAAMVYSSYKFSKLKVPYSDELMGAITQNLGIFGATLKYIYRDGKDEIMQMQRNNLKPQPPLEPGYGYGTNGGNYTTWTNDGKSESHIISFIVQNTKLIQTYGITHNYLFAFDYTQVNRGYNIYGTDSAYYDNDDVVYNGQIIKYRDRPVDNYARPWTLRLNTTHTFNIGKTKWLLNNFFGYKWGINFKKLSYLSACVQSISNAKK